MPAQPSSHTPPGQLAARARRLFTTGPVLKRLIQHYRPYICPFGQLVEQIPPGSTVLDAGCGGGLFLGLLASTGRIARGTGFDSSGPAIEIARRMAERLPAEQQVLTFHQLDAAAPWPNGPFDVVSIIDVMHHVPPRQHRELIQRAAERLGPGGTLLVKDIPPRPYWRACANRAHDLALARQWVHLPRPEDIRSWAEGEGLSLARSERINMLWYGHELMVFVKPGTDRCDAP